MSTSAYDSVLAPPMGGELAPPEDRTLIGRTKEIAITIDDIQAFPLNPRQSDNPRFDEIMASIEVIGLQQPLTVTKRPGDGVYTLYNGGNTRLKALQQLWKKHNDRRFYEVRCHFVEFRTDADILLHHMIENEVRGEMTLLDKAVAVLQLKQMYEEQRGGKPIPVRELAEMLAKDGWTINHNTAALFIFAAEKLKRVLPLALTAGIGRSRIEAIRKFYHAVRKYTDEQLAKPERLTGEAAQRRYLDLLASYDGSDYLNGHEEALRDLCQELAEIAATDQAQVHFELMYLIEQGKLYQRQPLEPLHSAGNGDRAVNTDAAGTTAHAGTGDGRQNTATGSADDATGTEGERESTATGDHASPVPGNAGKSAAPGGEVVAPPPDQVEKARQLLIEQVRVLRLRYPVVARHLDEQNDPPYFIPGEHAFATMRQELAQYGDRFEPLKIVSSEADMLEAAVYLELADLFAAWQFMQWQNSDDDTLRRYWQDGLEQVSAIQQQLQPLRQLIQGLQYGFGFAKTVLEVHQEFGRLADYTRDYARQAVGEA